MKLIYSWHKWPQLHYLSVLSKYAPEGTKLDIHSDLDGVLYSSITVLLK